MLTLTLTHAFMAVLSLLATYAVTYVLAYMFAHACLCADIEGWALHLHIAHHTQPRQPAPTRVLTVLGVTQAGTRALATASSHSAARS